MKPTELTPETPPFLTTMNELPSNSVSESGSSTNRPVSRFQPGQVANPLGRPKGSKNRITLLKLELEQALREQAAPRMDAVLDKAFAMALKGHPGMIKLLLELHISKTSDKDDTKSADDKITININQMPREKTVISTSPLETGAIEGEFKETPNG